MRQAILMFAIVIMAINIHASGQDVSQEVILKDIQELSKLMAPEQINVGPSETEVLDYLFTHDHLLKNMDVHGAYGRMLDNNKLFGYGLAKRMLASPELCNTPQKRQFYLNAITAFRNDWTQSLKASWQRYGGFQQAASRGCPYTPAYLAARDQILPQWLANRQKAISDKLLSLSKLAEAANTINLCRQMLEECKQQKKLLEEWEQKLLQQTEAIKKQEEIIHALQQQELEQQKKLQEKETKLNEREAGLASFSKQLEETVQIIKKTRGALLAEFEQKQRELKAKEAAIVEQLKKLEELKNK